MTKQQAIKEQFAQALKAFDEALDIKPGLSEKERAVYRDSAIQRFEFTTDLAGKLLKETLEDRFGIRVVGPKPVIREAFSQHLIDDDDAFWLSIIEMRNLTSHTYDEEGIGQIALRLPEVNARFQKLLDTV